MATSSKTNPHWSFWLIAVLILFWNVMGVMNYVMQLTPEGIEGFSEAHRAAIDSRPFWAGIGFVVAVFGGTLASVFLLLRKSRSVPLFIASAFGTALMMIYTFGAITASGLMGVSGILAMTLMPVVVSLLFVWYARLAGRKGWFK